MTTDDELLEKQQEVFEKIRTGLGIHLHPGYTEPTGKQCEARALLLRTDCEEWRACWYPQMGGYCGKAVVVTRHDEADASQTCFEAYVWHDGEFPFSEGNPRHIHHCCPKQFIRFGQMVADWQSNDQPPKETS